jgi:hypothetical protein
MAAIKQNPTVLAESDVDSQIRRCQQNQPAQQNPTTKMKNEEIQLNPTVPDGYVR